MHITKGIEEDHNSQISRSVLVAIRKPRPIPHPSLLRHLLHQTEEEVVDIVRVNIGVRRLSKIDF